MNLEEILTFSSDCAAIFQYSKIYTLNLPGLVYEQDK